MSTTSITPKRIAAGIAGSAAINAAVFSPLGDEWFFAMAIFGPFLTGTVVALLRADVRLAEITWAATGLFWLVLDYAVHREDVLFHLVLAGVMAGLVAVGAALGHLARRVRVRAAAH